MREPHHVTPAARPLPHPQSVHTSTHREPTPCLPAIWALGLDLDLDLDFNSNLRRVGLDRCHRRRPRKGFTMRRKFSLAWSLFSIASAVPASRLTSKPARPAMLCTTFPVSKPAPPSSGVNSTGLELGGDDYASTRVGMAACSTLDKVSAGSPCLVPPGSHRRPLKRSGSTARFVKNVRFLPNPCPYGLNKVSNPYDIAGSGSLKTSLYGPS